MTIFLKTFAQGYQFSKLWPKNEPYLHSFAQTRAVKLADLSLTVSPVIAFATAYLQLKLLGPDSLHLSMAMSLLILSLPLHGYFVLGQQAQQRLPLGLQDWYREIEQKLKQEQVLQSEANYNGDNQTGDNHTKMNSKLTYMDLAKLLNKLFMQK